MAINEQQKTRSKEGLTIAAGIAFVVVQVLVIGGVEGGPQMLPALADRRHVAAVAVGRRVAAEEDLSFKLSSVSISVTFDPLVGQAPSSVNYEMFHIV